MRALVIGMGLSGRSAAAYLLAKGWEVTGVDRLPPAALAALPDGVEFRSDGDAIAVGEFDLVVPSPGVAPSHPLVVAAKRLMIEVIGEVELALRACTKQVFGITGTNGKTTTTLLVAHLLQTMGLNAKAVGNIGVPLTAELGNPDSADIWVAELSSYQLETLSTKVLDGGVILNITPDHLDRYPDMASYAAAKARLVDALKPGAPLFVQEAAAHWLPPHANRTLFGTGLQAAIRYDGQRLIHEERIDYLIPQEYRNRGNHEVENFMAAYGLCAKLGVTSDVLNLALSSFAKPAHRIEFVRTLNGVNYFDDSKGTNIDATLKAVATMSGPTILIAGGVDKGFSYSSWNQEFAGRVVHVVAIGAARDKMARELTVALSLADSLDDAVVRAAKLAGPGMNVLLSPGCASTDMFRDYRHRGEEFKRMVNRLEETG